MAPTPTHVRGRRESKWWLVALAGGAFALVAVTGFAGYLIYRAQRASAFMNASRSAEEWRAETVAAFRDYDAQVDATQSMSAGARQEWGRAQSLLRQIEYALQRSDDEGFKSICDLERFQRLAEAALPAGKAKLLSGVLSRLSAPGHMSFDGDYPRLTLLALHVDPHDPSTRIAYVVASDVSSENDLPLRLWIVAQGEKWRLYDWERLDLGIRQSAQLAARLAEWDDDLDFNDWDAELDALVADLTADNQVGASRREAALIARIDRFRMRRDYLRLVAGYHLLNHGHNAAAIRFFDLVARPSDMPGVYRGRAMCLAVTEPARALDEAQKYEALVGVSVGLTSNMAHCYNRLQRRNDALAAWRNVLRFHPDHQRAWLEILVHSPDEERAPTLERLFQRPGGIRLAAELANSLRYRAPQAARAVREEITRREPNSPRTHMLLAQDAQATEEYEAAIEHLQQAIAREPQPAKRQECQSLLSYNLLQLGKVQEAYEAAADPRDFFSELVYGLEEGDVSLTRAEFAELVRLHRQRFPDDAMGLVQAVRLAAAAERSSFVETLTNKLAQAENADERTEELLRGELIRARLATENPIEVYRSLGGGIDHFQSVLGVLEEESQYPQAWQLVQTTTVELQDECQFWMRRASLCRRTQPDQPIAEDYLRALKLADENMRSFITYQLAEAMVWRPVVGPHNLDDAPGLFLQHCRLLIQDRSWPTLNLIVERRRVTHPQDPHLDRIAAEAAWEQEDYANFLVHARSRLANGNHETWEKTTLESRVFRALLGLQLWEEATAHAEQQDPEERGAYLAAIAAARGNVEETLRLIRTAPDPHSAAMNLYGRPTLHDIVFTPAFEQLHAEFPPTPWQLHRSVSGNWVAFFAESSDQLQKELEARFQEAAHGQPWRFEPSTQTRSAGQTLLVGRRGDERVTFLIGTMPYSHEWQLERLPESTRHQVEALQCWIALEAVEAPVARRQQLEIAARVTMRNLKMKGLYLPLSQHFYSDHLTEWGTESSWRQYVEGGIALQDTQFLVDRTSLEQSRAFRRVLRQRLTAGNLDSLQVAIAPNRDAGEIVWMQVRRVGQEYSSHYLEGTLTTSSLATSRFQQGAWLRVGSYEVIGFRDGANEPQFRP